MAKHARLLAPILTALLLTGGFLTFLGWQLQQGLHGGSTLQNVGAGTTVDASLTAVDALPVDVSDAALLALHQGDLLALQGNWKDAESKYQEAVTNGGGIAALRKLAGSQLQRRDDQGLSATRRQMQNAGAKPEELLLLDTIVLLRGGDVTKATTLLASAPDSPQKHYGTALVDILQGNHDGAKQELSLVLRGEDPVLRAYGKLLQAAYDEYAKFPDSPDIHLTTLLSRALAQSQQCELALPLLHQVVTKQDDYRDAWIVKGFCELTTERLDDARASLERAYNLDPEKPEVQYFLARTYSALRDHQNAVTFAQYALQNGFSPEAEARRFLAQEAETSGNASLALTQWKLLAQLPEAELSTFANVITLSLEQGQKQGALTAATQAVAKFPDDAKAYELRGVAQEGSSDRESARSSYQKALELDPSLKSARDKLNALH